MTDDDAAFKGLADKLRESAFQESLERVRALREGKSPSAAPAPAAVSAPPPPKRMFSRSFLVTKDAPEASFHALTVLAYAGHK